MTTASSDRWLARYAVFTAAIALLPIGMGALVTTLDAGMAFLDWPTSDGRNMFLYPWLQDFQANREKFVEHGHRLAGSLIGLFSIGLVAFTMRLESRGWVRALAIGILTAVVFQGLLGGFRVIADARVAAMIHGLFASVIFTTITVFALVVGSKWSTGGCGLPPSANVSKRLRSLAVATPLVIVGQSLLGGFVRHLGFALDEHLAGAILATALTVALIVTCWQSRQNWLRSTTIGLAVALLGQLLLGVGAWVTRFGFPPTGYVAVQQAPEQILFRTAHAVAAMIVLMFAVQLTARVLRLHWLQRGADLQLATGSAVGVGRLEACTTLSGGAMR